MQHNQNFLKNNKGVAIIEMAIILPVLLVLTFATIEFGNYFIRQMLVQRAVSTVATYVQTAYPNVTIADGTRINNEVKQLLSGLGGGFISETDIQRMTGWAYNETNVDVGNAALTDFLKNGGITAGGGNFGRSVVGYGNSEKTYFQVIRIGIPYDTLTSLPSLAGFNMPETIRAGVMVTIAPPQATSPTKSCADGEVVTYDAATNTYSCVVGGSKPPGESCLQDELVTYNKESNSYFCKKIAPNCDDGNFIMYKPNASLAFYCVKLVINAFPGKDGDIHTNYDYCAVSNIKVYELDGDANSEFQCKVERINGEPKNWEVNIHADRINGYQCDITCMKYVKN